MTVSRYRCSASSSSARGYRLAQDAATAAVPAAAHPRHAHLPALVARFRRERAWPCPAGPSPTACGSPSIICSARRSRSASPSPCCSSFRDFLAQVPRSSTRLGCCGAATAVFAPIAILIALYYRIAGFDRSIPFAGAAVGARRRLRARHRDADQARRARRAAGGERHLRHRLDRLARARAQPRSGEGLAHRGAGADGARHRLDRREAPFSGAPLARRRRHRRRVRPHRLGPAYRRRCRRHEADLQLAALRLRRPSGVLLVRRPHAAAPSRRCAGAHRRRGRHPVHCSAHRARGAPLPRRQRPLTASGSELAETASTSRSCLRW